MNQLYVNMLKKIIFCAIFKTLCKKIIQHHNVFEVDINFLSWCTSLFATLWPYKQSIYENKHRENSEKDTLDS